MQSQHQGRNVEASSLAWHGHWLVMTDIHHTPEPVRSVPTIASPNTEPLGSEFGGRNTWKSPSDLGHLPHK
jgi:hypothetical protein